MTTDRLSDDRADSIFRRWWSWLFLPPIEWVCSIPFLDAGAFFIPVVRRNAPLGIIGYFQKITVNPTQCQFAAIAAIHVAFWILFITGFALREILPLRWLRAIWLVLALALFMSVFDCAVQLGPGLRNQGDWH